ncbi:hypothetical protein GPL15_27035 [Clostridium sp. MCC353]|uniref:hypothetical protein n=1 Tax=Clostridium sp. MCC353 TaxID=2592646 RepID=UPI001C031357|nr:hypothetical protein [Clostridium sp. MCC353]MBT9780124.1 hypothetical protein [Clostridium sp. MCC353]
MIIQMDEKLKKEVSRDGSHLKYTRTKGGAGAGMIAAGVCFIVIGIMLVAALSTISDMTALMILLAGSVVLGLLFIVPGIFLNKRFQAGYMKYYVKKSGYSEEELNNFEREFQTGEALLINPAKKLTKQSKFESGIITRNWIKMPYMMPLKYSGIYRTVDIAAAFYEKKPVVNGEPLNPTLFIVDSRGDGVTMTMDETTGNEVIQEIAKRNPKTVTVRRFTYNGRNYDSLYNYQEVAELYREICRPR